VKVFLDYARRHHVGLLALFVALGGTSYATVKIDSADVRNGSLTGADVRNASIGKADLSRFVRDRLNPSPENGPGQAHATVAQDGKVILGKNLSAQRVGLGNYCVVPTPESGIDRRKVLPVVSPSRGSADGRGERPVTVYVNIFAYAFGACGKGWPISTAAFENAGSTFQKSDETFSVIVP
jgi:hypothetical protein